jgi:uncharacterized membrane protein
MVLGLIGAGVVHILALFLMPAMSPRDAWSRLEDETGLYSFSEYVPAASPASGPAGAADPFVKSVVCRFDLTDGYVHVTREGKVPYWSASVYDRSGQNVFSLNDRTAKNGVLDLVVVTPAQLVDIRKSPPAELEDSVFVEAPIEEGMVVVRGFQPDETWRQIVGEYLESIECSAEPV